MSDSKRFRRIFGNRRYYIVVVELLNRDRRAIVTQWRPRADKSFK